MVEESNSDPTFEGSNLATDGTSRKWKKVWSKVGNGSTLVEKSMCDFKFGGLKPAFVGILRDLQNRLMEY